MPSCCARTGQPDRHHLHENTLQEAITAAVRREQIRKRATSHILRHSFSTDLLESSNDIRTVQELVGHTHISTTMSYVHVLLRGACGSVKRPLKSISGIREQLI
ncbi:MAG: tyrosine-type recombinase/integrase [Aeoliella sp.]